MPLLNNSCSILLSKLVFCIWRTPLWNLARWEALKKRGEVWLLTACLVTVAGCRIKVIHLLQASIRKHCGMIVFSVRWRPLLCERLLFTLLLDDACESRFLKRSSLKHLPCERIWLRKEKDLDHVGQEVQQRIYINSASGNMQFNYEWKIQESSR